MGKVERISPEKAMQILQKNNIEVTREEAEIILEFMFVIAKIAVDIYLSMSD